MVQHAICIHRIAKSVSGLKVFPFIRIAVFSRCFLPSCLFSLSPCRMLSRCLVLSRRSAARSHCLLFSPPRYNASRCSPNTLALSPAHSPAPPTPLSARFPTSHSTHCPLSDLAQHHPATHPHPRRCRSTLRYPPFLRPLLLL